MNEFTKLYAPPSAIDSNGRFLNIEDELLKWLQRTVKESQNFLRTQRAWKIADLCMSLLYGDDDDKIPSGISKLSVKKLRRQAREAVANQADVRPRWQVKTFKKDKKFEDIAELHNQLSQHWFYNQFIDRGVKGALQYAAGGGTGYIFLWPDKDPLTNEIEITPTILDWRQVLPSHMPKNGTIDQANSVTIWQELPLPLAHEKYPEHISIIKADRNIPSWFKKGFEKAKKAFRGVIARKAEKDSIVSAADFPVADIFMTFIRDNEINDTGKEIIMGILPDAHWSYNVPSWHKEDGTLNEVFTGEYSGDDREKPIINNGAFGGYEKKKVYRPLKMEECKLYPKGRLVIWTNYGIIWDGPPLWGNGIVPVIDFYFEEIVGEFLKYPLLKDGAKLEESANRIFRSIEDSIIGKIMPPIGVHDQIPKPLGDKLAINPRRLIGKIFRYNTNLLSKAIVPLLSWEYFEIDKNAFAFLKFLHELQDYLAGTNDFTAWQRLKQMPAQDTQESMIQNLGILATDQARGMERSFQRMGKIFLDFAPQVYTTQKRLTILGRDGITEENFDFDPNSIIPFYDPNDSRPRWKRVQEFMKNFSMHTSPNSIQERQSVTNKLTLLQVKKQEVPISDRKIYDAFIDDGDFDKTKTEWINEQKEKAVLAAEIKGMVDAIMQKLNPQTEGAGGESDILGKIAKALEGNKEGRPSNDSAPARLEIKTDDDGVQRGTSATN